jgi:hypothetical protein
MQILILLTKNIVINILRTNTFNNLKKQKLDLENCKNKSEKVLKELTEKEYDSLKESNEVSGKIEDATSKLNKEKENLEKYLEKGDIDKMKLKNYVDKAKYKNKLKELFKKLVKAFGNNNLKRAIQSSIYKLKDKRNIE